MERRVAKLIFAPVLRQAIDDGLAGVALVDKHGATIELDGEITEDEAQPLAALVMSTLKGPDLAERLFAGDVVKLELDGRDVALAIARRKLFVVAVLRPATTKGLERVGELRGRVAGLIGEADPDERFGTIPPWGSGSGSGGAGPAELPVVEWGVTVGRERGKA